jgi:transcriptional regulator with XRE-family HTH domain
MYQAARLVFLRPNWADSVSDMQHIPHRIEAARTAHDLSLTQLAERSGVPRQTLSRRLVDPESFTLGELERIAIVLDTTTESLLLDAVA